MSPATAMPANVRTESGNDLGEGREITIVSPGSPLNRLRGRVAAVTSHGMVFVFISGMGFLQFRPDEIS